MSSEQTVSDPIDDAISAADAERRAAFVTGLREVADLLERDPRAPLPFAHLAIHLDADEFERAIVRLGLDRDEDRGGYAAASISFGPVKYGVQTNIGPLRERGNLDAFWTAYNAGARHHVQSSREIRDMAGRYGLTGEQTEQVIGRISRSGGR